MSFLHDKDSVLLSELPKIEVCTNSVHHRFIIQIKENLKKGKDIFPRMYGLNHVKRRLTEVLMTGSGVLLKGDFGVGKTELAKAVFDVLKEYYANHRIYAPAGCPVRENAVHLYRALTDGDALSLSELCPVCRQNYITGGVSMSEIEIQRVYLDEGSGFARIQGNEDIEPERILGMYHLTRYAEIGDPFDPRVLEPGKIAQGAGGVIFVDELGLLNKEAQYAFIQGLQEKHFTPTNSRMTFPVDFLFISTTNSINEFQIHRAIQNRLVSIRIDRVDHDDEVKIVKKELYNDEGDILFPEFLLSFIVDSIRVLNNISVFLGPRSTIRAARIAVSSAVLEDRRIVNFCDVKEGIFTEILGQSDDESIDETTEMLNNDFPSIADFIADKLPEIESLKPEIDAYDDIDALIEDIDDKFLDDTTTLLPESERTREMAVLYIHAYLKGCAGEQV